MHARGNEVSSHTECIFVQFDGMICTYYVLHLEVFDALFACLSLKLQAVLVIQFVVCCSVCMLIAYLWLCYLFCTFPFSVEYFCILYNIYCGYYKRESVLPKVTAFTTPGAPT